MDNTATTTYYDNTAPMRDDSWQLVIFTKEPKTILKLVLCGQEELHQLIQWMGGEVSKNFHEKVTHLVAGEVGSKKYIVSDSYTGVECNDTALLSVEKTRFEMLNHVPCCKLVCSLYIAPVHSAL